MFWKLTSFRENARSVDNNAWCLMRARFIELSPPVIYKVIEKSLNPFLTHIKFVKKKNYTEIRKQKNNVILSVENIHRVQRCMHSLFSSCLMQPGEEFLQWCLKCTAQYFVSILLMCVGCLCTRSPSKPPKDRNPVAIHPGIEGGQVSRNNATTKVLAQHLHCWSCCMRRSPILLKPAVSFVNFKKGNEINSQFLVTFTWYRFTEEIGTNYPPSGDSTPYSGFQGVKMSHGRYADFQHSIFCCFGY
jgi:hypothetical protein